MFFLVVAFCPAAASVHVPIELQREPTCRSGGDPTVRLRDLLALQFNGRYPSQRQLHFY